MGASINDAPTNEGVKSQSITVLGKYTLLSSLFSLVTCNLIMPGDHVCIADEVNIRNCIVLPNKELTKSFKNEILM
jgi:hypothetical protein